MTWAGDDPHQKDPSHDPASGSTGSTGAGSGPTGFEPPGYAPPGFQPNTQQPPGEPGSTSGYGAPSYPTAPEAASGSAYGGGPTAYQPYPPGAPTYQGTPQPYPGGAQPYGGSQPYGSQPSGTSPYGQPPAPQRRTNVLALIGLICAIAGVVTWISAPIGAILGHVAQRQIAVTGEEGAGMAKAAIWVGWVITGLGLILCCGAILLAVSYGNGTTQY